MPDPLDRLTLTQQKIDALFGADYARSHPEVLVVVVQSAASDWAAARLAAALEFIGRSLLVEEAEAQQHILPARELLRPRP
jgi:hypothetical protein